MEIKQFLLEISTSKNPQSLMDSFFKKENTDPQPDVNVVVDELHKHLISALTSSHPSWMSDSDIVEANEMIRNEIGSKMPEMVNAIQDGIDRNYDIVKYIEFMKVVTTMMTK